ncbi:hypothetical protein [uncultured Sphingomonas sp.]|uniref:hypothetical protein n=1 Tax=uncultured Sphingomonas sp. TaxID=158754 RepID=UPI00260032A2|nr:hypothetical protein [uncultured Sphingomonas sp.]
MNPDQTAHVRAHVAAVSKLLLGNKIMNPGLMILAGNPLDHSQQIAFGRTAVEAQVDLVYLAFTLKDDGVPVMTGITLMLPRDTICFVSTGCRLSLVPGKARAVIVPQDGAQSHFKVLPGEIVQVRGRPASLVAGCDRATTKLAMLVRDGVDVAGQVALRDHVPA